MKRRAFVLLAQFLLSILLIVVFVFSARDFIVSNSSALFKSVNIKVIDEDNFNFVTSTEINQIVNSFRYTKNKTLLDSINLVKISKSIKKSRYVENAWVYRGGDGSLNIVVEQFKPILVVRFADGLYMFNKIGEGLPIRSMFTSTVPYITSDLNMVEIDKLFRMNEKNIDSNSQFVKKVCNFVTEINDDDLLSNLVIQININKNREIELIPRLGAKVIVLCDIVDIDNSEIFLSKIDKFYKTMSKNNTLSKYKTINFKYNKQIVAQK